MVTSGHQVVDTETHSRPRFPSRPALGPFLGEFEFFRRRRFPPAISRFLIGLQESRHVAILERVSRAPREFGLERIGRRFALPATISSRDKSTTVERL